MPGVGQFSGETVPISWPKRMTQVVSAVMRKVQDATKQRLHDHAKAGRIDGFVYAALGQIDRRIPLKPGQLGGPRTRSSATRPISQRCLTRTFDGSLDAARPSCGPWRRNIFLSD